MSSVRAAWRLLRALVQVLHGLWQVLLLFPRLDARRRQQRVARWSAGMLGALGVGLQSTGSFRGGGTLLVANHVSWMDILAVHALCPRARFVSKAEVRHWPLLSRLIDAGNTLYLERERKRDALRVVHHIAQALRAGDMVAVFPEGTTGDGHALLPFHANLLQAAIATATPLQPLALRYADATHGVSSAVSWVGTTSLLHSLWRIASARGLRVQMQVLPALSSAQCERRALAQAVHDLLAAKLLTRQG